MNNWKTSNRPQEKFKVKHKLRQQKAKQFRLMADNLKKGIEPK
jgi:hypothetical protein